MGLLRTYSNFVPSILKHKTNCAKHNDTKALEPIDSEFADK